MPPLTDSNSEIDGHSESEWSSENEDDDRVADVPAGVPDIDLTESDGIIEEFLSNVDSDSSAGPAKVLEVAGDWESSDDEGEESWQNTMDSGINFGAYSTMKSCFLAREATMMGKALIDCGATESLGGIVALENLARLNAKKYGTSKMRIDRNDRPTYTFGNGESATVDGRATFEVEAAGSPGTIDFHGIDAKGVPMLLSSQALKKMGAVINFENGQAKFLKLHPEMIVQLETSSTGHWLLDLSEDIYAKEVPPDAARLNGDQG